jgi:hypothetical protein
MSQMTNVMRFYYISLFIIDIHAISFSHSKNNIDEMLTSNQTLLSATASNSLSCIDDECYSRLLANIDVHTYEIDYVYNNINQTTVQGHVTINFTLNEPITQLIYHGKRLIDLSMPILNEDGVLRSVVMRQYPPNDYISLRLTSEQKVFTPNRYYLSQNFTVNLTDGNLGFYQGIFNDGNGTRR